MRKEVALHHSSTLEPTHGFNKDCRFARIYDTFPAKMIKYREQYFFFSEQLKNNKRTTRVPDFKFEIFDTKTTKGECVFDGKLYETNLNEVYVQYTDGQTLNMTK